VSSGSVAEARRPRTGVVCNASSSPGGGRGGRLRSRWAVGLAPSRVSSPVNRSLEQRAAPGVETLAGALKRGLALGDLGEQLVDPCTIRRCSASGGTGRRSCFSFPPEIR